MNALHLVKDAHDETLHTIESYRDLDRQIKALTKQKDLLGQSLKAGYFAENDDFIVDGKLIATYRMQLRVSLDQAKLKADMPELFKQYEKIQEVRALLLK